MHFVRDAAYVTDHILRLSFEDGTAKLVDLLPHFDGPIFEPLKDVQFFKQFKVNHDLDTIVWENGADFSPDFLYEIGQPVDASLQTAG